jgi:hypothetical protein
MKTKTTVCFGSLCLTVFLVSPGLAIDLQPLDLQAPPAGLKYIQWSYLHSERGAPYKNGEKLPIDSRIRSSQLALRIGQAFNLADYPALAYAHLPIAGYVHPEAALSGREGDSGIGDASFLMAVWPYANREKQTYVGVGAYLTVPTGSYRPERELLNMGTNRYAAALQAGFLVSLAPKWHVMAAYDMILFGKNSAFGASHADFEQDPLHTAQAGLSYSPTPEYSMNATYSLHRGGETSINQVSRQNAANNHRYLLSGNAQFSFGRITLQYGQDIETEQGFIEDNRWILRFSKRF